MQVLAVCTGNICRSPQTALLFASRFSEAQEADRIAMELPTFASAGTMALVGQPMDPRRNRGDV
jgi:protein-tyrosine phosphatase